MVGKVAYMEVSNFNYDITRGSIIVPWHMSPVLSAKVKRELSQNKRFWHTLDIGNVFRPIVGLRNPLYSQFKE